MRAATARLRPPHLAHAESLRETVRGQRALEVGGPSHAFTHAGLIPLYDVLGRLDLVDFNATTIWSESGETDRSIPHGRLVIVEASELVDIAADEYDIVINAGVLEHLADPLTALAEWRRVLRPGGRILVLVPRREDTFDRRRPLTTADHLLSDRGQGEDDRSHMAEVLALYDHARAEEILTPRELAERINRNPELRWMHHHVFDDALVVWAFGQVGLVVEWQDYGWPFWICTLGRKP